MKTFDELRAVLRACSSYFATAAVFSLAINVLYLAAPLYMLQISDRVVSSGSKVTLVMLTFALLMAYGALAALDAVRARVLTRTSIRLDRLLAARIMTAIVERAAAVTGSRSQLLRDFDTFRQFVTGAGIHAIFDLPWAPIYIGVIFVLHPLLGSFALGSSILLIILALLNEWVVKRPLGQSNEAAGRNYRFTEMSLRNTEVVQAMGMTAGLLRRWARDRDRMIELQALASDRAAMMSSIIRFLRLAMQSLVLGLGAYLVIERSATVGAMFAASILLSRALQPVEQIVGSWRNLVSARAAFGRIRELLSAAAPQESGLSLPRPTGRIAVEGLSYAAPDSNRPILRAISLRIEAGEVLGVIGPSGAGKSTFARQIIGVLAPSAGVVRLDGADVALWPRASLGRHVGYLPQDIELFADTVAANISRFNAGDDEAVIRAAQMAGVHEMTLRLPKGYDTEVGEGGAILSGGYRQRIGLARAVYGDPSLVVLDEPSSNLDNDGDVALAHCVARLKQRGTSVIIVSHRPDTLAVADKILCLREGMVDMFGSRAEVIAQFARPTAIAAAAAA